MAKKLKIGVIGCGEIAVDHTEGISLTDNAVVGMTMDTNLALAKDLGEKYGAPYTDKLDDLLASDVDAVYIAVPHFLHAPITIRAAEAGKHVMVEKPIATTPEDAEKMIAVCSRKKVRLSVCFVLRYRNFVVKAKELMDRKIIGDVVGAQLYALGRKEESYWSGGYSGRAKTDWRMLKEKSGGGILIMNASHNIDYVRYITGLDITRVYSEYDTFETPVEVEDALFAVMRFSNGAIGTINATSCFHGSGNGPGFIAERLYGKKGQIVMDDDWLDVYSAEGAPGFEAGKWTRLELGKRPNVRQKYVQEFAEAVLGNKKMPIPAEDGLKCLEVITKAYKK